MSKPVVAIVGRQNVGKSTLLNRIAGKRVAIVEDLPGTTRDRLSIDVTWDGREFTIVDTGGIDLAPSSNIAQAVNKQISIAIEEADIIMFVVDARDGLLPDDIEVSNILRRSDKPVVLVANKADNDALEAQAMEFHQLGLGDPQVISAYHGRGSAELLDKIVSLLPPEEPAPAGPQPLNIAIVGKPGVGKSSLLNTILGRERVVVNDVPGTTRDAIDTLFDFDGQSMLLIDTAGIKRRGKIEVGVEQYSVIRSLRAIERADIALLVLDASEPVAAQDTHIGGFIQEAAKGVILVMNKWDLAVNRNKNDYVDYLRQQFQFLSYAPVLFLSSKTGEGIDSLMPQIIKVSKERSKRISTNLVNGLVQQAVAEHSPPPSKNKPVKILYATQPEINPPTIVFFVNDARLIHFSYKRYLENKLREAFGFEGTPIRLSFKTRGE